MAQHDRTIKSYSIEREPISLDFQQCSVVDGIWLDGSVHIDDGYKVAAAIIEAYRFRGYSIDEQFQMIRDQIAEWDKNEDNS